LGLLGLGEKVCEMSGSKRWLMSLDKKLSHRKNKEGNMRDYATIEQLLVLANLENVNALYVSKGISQSERIEELNHLAREQLVTMEHNRNVDVLKKFENKKV
jgi:hypothetical protein